MQIAAQQRSTKSFPDFIRANVPPIRARRGDSPEKSVPNRCGLRYIGTRRFVRTISAIVRANPHLIGTYPPLSQRRPCLDRHCVPARLSLERPWKPPRNIPVAIHHCGATCASVQQLHAATRSEERRVGKGVS